MLAANKTKTSIHIALSVVHKIETARRDDFAPIGAKVKFPESKWETLNAASSSSGDTFLRAVRTPMITTSHDHNVMPLGIGLSRFPSTLPGLGWGWWRRRYVDRSECLTLATIQNHRKSLAVINVVVVENRIGRTFFRSGTDNFPYTDEMASGTVIGWTHIGNLQWWAKLCRRCCCFHPCNHGSLCWW